MVTSLSVSSAPTDAAQDPLCLSSCSSALLTWCLCAAHWEPQAPLGKAVHSSWVLAWLGSLVLCFQVQDSALPLGELYAVLVAQSLSLFPSLKDLPPLNTQFSDTINMVRVLLVPLSRSFTAILQCGAQY